MIGEKLNEAYTWQAIYDFNPLYEGANLEGIANPIVFAGDLSGEILADLWEMDAQGVQRATYADIDRARVKYFHVYKTVDVIAAYSQPLKNIPVIVFQPFLAMAIPPNARLIWRKRRRQRVFYEGGVFLTLYMVGWQETIESRNYQTLNYIYHFTQYGFDTQNDIVILSGGGKSDVELFDFELCLSAGLKSASTDHKPASGGGELRGIDEYKGQNICLSVGLVNALLVAAVDEYKGQNIPVCLTPVEESDSLSHF